MKKSEILQKVLEIVSECTEITEEQILSDCRQADVVDARCMTVYWLRQTGITARNIMQWFAFKSHSSVCYHTAQYSARIKTDNYFRSIALFIGEQIIKSGVKR